MERIKCTKCGIEKDSTEFFFRNKLTGKRHSQCKVCYNEHRRVADYYSRKSDEYKRRAKLRRDRVLTENRQLLLEYFHTHPCVDCGEGDPVVLEFNHQMDKKYNIAQMMDSYKWETIMSEISKCEVVCANCHKRRTAKAQLWWKRPNG